MKHNYSFKLKFVFVLVDEAVEIAADAIFSNHGQNCCAGSRTFVQSKIYNEFVTKAAAKANSIKVGDPFCPESQQGPQVIKHIFYWNRPFYQLWRHKIKLL